ncbi:hypothetical protein PIB30_014808 [Stylosanthes scabra]|uniref:Uncharacterized protein n=1 Tax=Stylosanthes scabra TaxID=79078 RepID=A0ABU6Q6N8_9FABA|nr:hypothetical protein [Stylosanthes scabra]
MASTKILFLNSFLERRNKKKNNKKGSNCNNKKDDLDVVKAAAWAWYEHGSGSSEGNNKGLMNEFDITRRKTTHQRTSTRPPSRYKLEAMKRMAELNNDHHQEGGGGVENNIKSHRKKENSLLFDAYEVQSISRQIDSHIVIESNKNKNNTSSSSSSSSLMMKKNKKEKTKGFWLRHGAVCGRGEDVVDPSTSAIRGGGGGRVRGRRQASRVPDLVK